MASPRGACGAGRRHDRAGGTARLVVAQLGLWMAFFTPIQQLLPRQVESIDPRHKAIMLGLVTGFGALAAVIANPLAGALSDRTAPRIGGHALGRRHVWTLGGALLGAAALVLLSRQHTIAGVALAWVAAQTCFNTMLASLTAAVPDRVPVAQRGAVSGWIGMPSVLGVVIALIVALFALPFALTTPDDPLPHEHRSPLKLPEIVKRMWVSPREHPDFAWAWITRFRVQLGNALGTLYLLYFLKDRVGYANPEGGLFILILVYCGAVVATTVVAGRRSD